MTAFLTGAFLTALFGILIQQAVAFDITGRRQARRDREAHRQQLMVHISTPGAEDMDALIAELLDTPRVPQQYDGRWS